MDLLYISTHPCKEQNKNNFEVFMTSSLELKDVVTDKKIK